MKCVLSCLSPFIALHEGLTLQQLSDAFVQLGHEVEGLEAKGFSIANVVVGKVLERIQHPNADKLGVCTVDAGEGQTRQIVCGAPNARAGMTVAVALPGAVLPGDFTIKVSKIRDVESCGMLCSLRELGLGTEHNGIWELTTDAAPGTPITDANLAEITAPETVLDLSITPNRGDCFSHLGLARELAALGLGTLKPLPDLPEGAAACTFTAETRTPDCPRIALIEITGLTNAPSPRAVQAQLEAAGLRPKNALVDATNLTMLLLGQPLHAYDADKVSGTILAADNAQTGESFEGLGDVKLTLNGGEVVIRDATHAAGLGGILGGTTTAVSETTTRVVLEAAYFNPVRIALTGQAHGVFTDARQRFERGVDPAMGAYALQFCARLLANWAGGTVSRMVVAGDGVAAPAPIAYNPSFFQTFIGHAVTSERQKTTLEALGFTVNADPVPWLVVPPSYRTYMSTPEDLTEEILRVEGYDQVVPQLPPAMGAQPRVDGRPVVLDRAARKAVAAAGFYEVMTYSFIGQKAAEPFANGATLLDVANPLAQTDMATMRPSLLPGLLAAAAKNAANSEPVARLAEVGKVFTTKGERLMAAGVLLPLATRHWKGGGAKPDAFTAKAAVLQVLETLGAPLGGGQISSPALPHYHPGRSGTVQVGPFTLAHFGELHPALAKQYGVKGVMVFELELEPLLKLSAKPRPWQNRPYPPVLRDFAFMLPQTVTAQQLVQTLQNAVPAAQKAWVQRVEVFDRYVGERVDATMQSLAVALTLQSAEKTLTEGDILPLVEALTLAVKTKLGGELRA